MKPTLFSDPSLIELHWIQNHAGKRNWANCFCLMSWSHGDTAGVCKLIYIDFHRTKFSFALQMNLVYIQHEVLVRIAGCERL